MRTKHAKTLLAAFLTIALLITLAPAALAASNSIQEGVMVSGTLSRSNPVDEYTLGGMATSSYWGISLSVTVKNAATYEIWLMESYSSGNLWEGNFTQEFYPDTSNDYHVKNANGFTYVSPIAKYAIDSYKYTISVPEYMWEEMGSNAIVEYTLELHHGSDGYSPDEGTETDDFGWVDGYSPTAGNIVYPFYDVSESAWYADSVRFVVDKGLFSGDENSLFNPDEPMTRGMLVTVLGRRAEIDTSSYSGSNFSDVSSREYYAPYVNWASSLGIVNGVGGGRFEPEGVISREDLATILYRYVSLNGGDTSMGNSGSYNVFADRSSVSDYAVTPMRWAVSRGIIGGTNITTLSPKANATRAQVAKIFMTADPYL